MQEGVFSAFRLHWHMHRAGAYLTEYVQQPKPLGPRHRNHPANGENPSDSLGSVVKHALWFNTLFASRCVWLVERWSPKRYVYFLSTPVRLAASALAGELVRHENHQASP